ncbi:MAG TPA: SGNH/GDSL hydrolase family protein [Thermoanaerobaculia bacterium]|nr:SGNH/GDSL hydrolase family protein [Thermoanaerobaculia bacterium]
MSRNNRIAAALLMFAVAVPMFGARGEADFTRFVALGDSYGAGVSNGSLNERHQIHSWPAIIARQAGAPDFVQPLVTYPGFGPELTLVDIVSFPPVIRPASGAASTPDLTFPRPWNNLSIPGAAVQHMTTLTGAQQPTNTPTQMAQFILRGLGTPVQQAIALDPTFIAIWIGGNDLLGAVLAGTPAALTPVDTFRTAYNTMLDQLVAGAPDAGMVVGNLPTNPLSLPLLTTVQPVIINPATRQPLLIGGNPVFLIAQGSDGSVSQLQAGDVVLLSAASKIALGMGIPPQLATQPPFNQLPAAGQPLAATDVLTVLEQQQIQAWANEYNEIIEEAARQRDIPVANIKGLFDRFASGTFIGPFQFTPAYISGGIFSLDGFHLTDIGYMMFANEYIRTINAAYDEEIPVAGLWQYFANNGATTTSSGAPVFDGMEWMMSEEAAASILRYAAPAPARRLRSAGR